MRRSSPDGKAVREGKDGADKVHFAERPDDMAGHRGEWMRHEAERHVGGLVLCAEVLELDPKGTGERMRTWAGRQRSSSFWKTHSGRGGHKSQKVQV